MDSRAHRSNHAVGEEGVRLRAIADVVGKGLRLPVRLIAPAEAQATRAALGWEPNGPGLIADLEKLEWV